MNLVDPHFRVKVVSASEHPQTTCYIAAHQDYSEGFAFDEFLDGQSEEMFHWKDPFNRKEFLSESKAGERLVSHCVKFNHWGVLEHPQLVVNAAGFPHEVMQQLRTHRIMSFDVQSGRYTGQRIVRLSKGEVPESTLEEIFYLRPLGDYTDRKGHKYTYTQKHKDEDLAFLWAMTHAYRNRIDQGFAEEHARQVYSGYCLRQNFVASANLRSWLHLIDVRHKADVQIETQAFAEEVWKIIKEWVPEVAAHYEKTRLGKNKLAP